jgi:hypothetical protein
MGNIRYITNIYNINTMIDFENELKPYVVGGFTVSDWFSIVMYTNHSPKYGDKINVYGVSYDVDIIHDASDDDEMETGLSFTKIHLIKTQQ